LSTTGGLVFLPTYQQKPTTNSHLKTNGHYVLLIMLHGSPIGGTLRNGFLHRLLQPKNLKFSPARIWNCFSWLQAEERTTRYFIFFI
jgi:hypothetical protein